VADEPVRLRVVAHQPTAAASALVFGDAGPLLRGVRTSARAAAEGSARCGPEPACAQTAQGLGAPSPQVDRDLRGPAFGAWTGRALAEVAEHDPAGLVAWLGDPDARPHGGETLAELVTRVGPVLNRPDSEGTRRLWVVTPLVARAVTVAAVGAGPGLIFGLDVAFGGCVLLSGGPGRWRLAGLSRGGGGLG